MQPFPVQPLTTQSVAEGHCFRCFKHRTCLWHTRASSYFVAHSCWVRCSPPPLTHCCGDDCPSISLPPSPSSPLLSPNVCNVCMHACAQAWPYTKYRVRVFLAQISRPPGPRTEANYSQWAPIATRTYHQGRLLACSSCGNICRRAAAPLTERSSIPATLPVGQPIPVQAWALQACPSSPPRLVRATTIKAGLPLRVPF